MSEWTKQPPTEPGWYWWRVRGNASITLKVYFSGGILRANTRPYPLPVIEINNGEWWAEQIPEPSNEQE